MKLLVQSDDYGITRAVSQGCLHGIEHGIIRNTGLFANMPWVEECVGWIKPYLDRIALGIDVNASTGPSILGYDKVPVLVHEDGSFLTSRENRALDNEGNQFDHLAVHRDQLYSEFKAQIERYIELLGRKPDYLHNHAYGTRTTEEISRQLAREYGLLYTNDVMARDDVRFAGMGWYVRGGWKEQLTEDPISYVTEDRGNVLGSEYGYLITHCGYTDAELFELSSFSLCRIKDLECLTSDAVKEWIINNGVELITFRDLPREWIEK